MASIGVTKENYDKLKKAYDSAVEQKLETFTFDGTELLTAYAKYLLEYFVITLNKTKN